MVVRTIGVHAPAGRVARHRRSGRPVRRVRMHTTPLLGPIEAGPLSILGFRAWRVTGVGVDPLPDPVELRVLVIVWFDAPPAADPLADSPHPPAGDLRVEEVRIGMHPLTERGLIHEPFVARVKICLVDRPIGPACNVVRCRVDGAPEVSEVAIRVVDRLDLRRMRSPEEHCAASEEGFHKIRHIAECLPNDVRDSSFTAKPRERGAQCVAHREPPSVVAVRVSATKLA